MAQRNTYAPPFFYLANTSFIVNVDHIMPNPGAFQGSRREFLCSEKEAYSLAIDGGYTSEALALIYRRYFKRFPIDLPHDTEPTTEHLAAVDDNATDPDIPEPDIFAMVRKDYDLAMEKVKERKTRINFRKGQIKRWMAYQYMKDHHVDPKETGAHNPYCLLMCKLIGRTTNRPCRKTPVNVWRKTHRAQIEDELKAKHGSNVPKTQLATLRDKIARDMFAKLDQETRRHWEDVAKQEHDVALDQWSTELNTPPSTDPVDRQRSIQGLMSFMQPILDMICDVTGWKVSLIAGGPEPAQDGQLNIISIHSGTTAGDVRMTFGAAERGRIKKFLVPTFGSFLQMCYSPEECRSRALSAQGGHLRVSQLDMENANVLIHGVRRSDRSQASSGSQASSVAASAPPLPIACADTPTSQEDARINNSQPSTSPQASSVATSAPPLPVACADTPTSHQDASITISGAVGDDTTTTETTSEGLTNDDILAGEGDTLEKLTSPPEDEVEIVSSRSVSPTLTEPISPVPSPLPSRCPSPIGVPSPLPSPGTSNLPIEVITPPNFQGLAEQNVTIDDPSTTVSAPTALSDHLNPIPIASSSDIPGKTVPLARCSTRSVKKTPKLILLEEKEVKRGRKRGAEVLVDGSSTVNQAAMKRRQVGKKGNGHM